MERKDTEGIIKEVLDTLKECIEYEEYMAEYECMGEDQLNRLKQLQEKLKKTIKIWDITKESNRAPDAEGRERIGLEFSRITFVLIAKSFLIKQELPN